MLENHPEYFDLLARRLKEWAKENPYNIPIIVVDSGKYNYVDKKHDAFLVADQVQREVVEKLEGRKGIILPHTFALPLEVDLLRGSG